MAAFKQHCTFGFWKASLLKDPEQILTKVGKTAMGHFERITSVEDLPSDKILIAYIKEAAKLNEQGVKLPPKEKAPVTKIIEVPTELTAALRRNKKALKTFDEFSPSHRKEYIEWITEAKSDATKEKRIETAIEWLSEGKQRHWKYVKK